jgi:hypothetical protein
MMETAIHARGDQIDPCSHPRAGKALADDAAYDRLRKFTTTGVVLVDAAPLSEAVVAPRPVDSFDDTSIH